MNLIRPPAVAGLFYPANREELAIEIGSLLGDAAVQPLRPKALIVPHAGYIYSGPVAASAYAALAPLRRMIRRVVLLGPAHRVALHGLAGSDAERFRTPLGDVRIDRDAVAAALQLHQVSINEHAHREEHSIEVHLPFLQTVLDDFALVPFVVGMATANEVAEVIELLWGGEETLIVVSSDLSHYHPYAAALKLDRHTAQMIEHLDPLPDHERACGATPINGLLRAAQRHGLAATLLDLRNSGDTAGDRARVVGYAAFAFSKGDSPPAENLRHVR
ncbi:MAG: AmmeMemoRadiSam system protein B [Rhodocyclaceae bacterium]|nr:AmmeMemoRadiSam system protein B [Rhodocyclaceae bacterium]